MELNTHTSLKPPPLGGPKLSLESDIVGHLRCKFGASWAEKKIISSWAILRLTFGASWGQKVALGPS